jgi:hypothetical protein
MANGGAALAAALGAITVGAVFYAWGIEEAYPKMARKVEMIATSYASLLALFISLGATAEIAAAMARAYQGEEYYEYE